MNRALELPLISVDLAREADFWIGALKVQPSYRQVSANGQQETVQPRVMQVLVALARAKGAVLSRDSLVETCWDRLSVGDDAINRCVAKVRQIASLGGGQHFEIETIPRVGYRLAPIPHKTVVDDAATIQPRGIGAGRSPTPIRTRINRGIVLAGLAVAIVALVAVGYAWIFRPQSHLASLARRDPLLAVLPFRNLSSDADSRYFSDSVTQEIIDALLQTTEIRVAAPGTSFALRNSSAPRMAQTLAATHVLSGSVERHGSDLRVVAQLEDMGGNRVIWSHIYRMAVVQTPELQHHIAVKIANTLDVRLSSRSLNEAARVDPAAYDHYLRGRDLFRQRHNIAVAAKELEAAVALAPNFAKAWSTLAAVRYLRGAWASENQAPMFKAARAAANHALAFDRDNSEALGVLALTSGGSMLTVDRLFERGLRAEPNSTQLLNWHHNFLYSVGRYHEASDEIERAYDLDRLTPAIVYNAALNSVEYGNFERARQVIELGLDYCSPEETFALRAEYLLVARDWKGLARHLHTLPAGVGPQLAAFYHLVTETATAIYNSHSDDFAALRARWRAAIITPTVGDRYYTVTFLTLLGDTKGALGAIDAAIAAGESSESSLLFVPTLPALRRDPGAKVLMAKLGLFEYWQTSNHWPDFCGEPGFPFDCKVEARRLKA